MTTKMMNSPCTAMALAALILIAPAFGAGKTSIPGLNFTQSAQAGQMGMRGAGMRGASGMMSHHRMGGMGGLAGGLAVGLLGGVILNSISSASIEDTATGEYERCINICGTHIHTTNRAGEPPVKIVKPQKLHRTDCDKGRCKPIKYGNYDMWPYEDAQGNKFAKITDADGNPVNTGSSATINGYKIIK